MAQHYLSITFIFLGWMVGLTRVRGRGCKYSVRVALIDHRQIGLTRQSIHTLHVSTYAMYVKLLPVYIL